MNRKADRQGLSHTAAAWPHLLVHQRVQDGRQPVCRDVSKHLIQQRPVVPAGARAGAGAQAGPEHAEMRKGAQLQLGFGTPCRRASLCACCQRCGSAGSHPNPCWRALLTRRQVDSRGVLAALPPGADSRVGARLQQQAHHVRRTRGHSPAQGPADGRRSSCCCSGGGSRPAVPGWPCGTQPGCQASAALAPVQGGAAVAQGVDVLGQVCGARGHGWRGSSCAKTDRVRTAGRAVPEGPGRG